MANMGELIWRGKKNILLRYPAILMHDLVWLRKPKSDVGKSNLRTDWKIKVKLHFKALVTKNGHPKWIRPVLGKCY